MWTDSITIVESLLFRNQSAILRISDSLRSLEGIGSAGLSGVVFMMVAMARLAIFAMPAALPLPAVMMSRSMLAGLSAMVPSVMATTFLGVGRAARHEEHRDEHDERNRKQLAEHGLILQIGRT